jgi:Alpha/beta hydrolase of unknown function (DUF1400)
MTSGIPGFQPRLSHHVASFGVALAIGLAAVAVPEQRALAAERIYFTYGPFGRSIPIGDLRTFADTGETTRQLRWYLRFADVEPEAFRQVLTREVGLNGEFVDSAANTIPGEYVLYQVGQIIHTKSRQGAVQIKALRSSLVLSTVKDNRISILEFLEKYPTPEVYVDGVVLARLARRVSNFVERIEPTIAVIQEFLANLLCDCNPPSDSSGP